MTEPLRGKRILVTRTAAQSAHLARAIAGRGGAAVCVPLLEIGPADDPRPLQAAIGQLDNYSVAVFISPNAVDFGVPPILAAHPWPPALQIVATGPGTAAQLATKGVGPVLVPDDRFDSEGLLELPVFAPARIAGQRVLILRGNGGRALLADSLRARGAGVDAVPCYRRSRPADQRELLLSSLHNNRLDAVTLSSSEGLRNLLALLDTEAVECLRALPVFVAHRRIAELAAEFGLPRVILTAPADAGIIESLCAYNWPDHERNS